jgi:uncharacterized protein
MNPFHLAIPVHDLEAARRFYKETLGCSLGRESEKWIDFNFFGHQLSVHLKPEETGLASANAVDGKQVPVRHFGIVLPWEEWHALSRRLKAANTEFVIEPYIRFAGEVGEQATMFFMDPSGNALEFKSFKDISQLFAA